MQKTLALWSEIKENAQNREPLSKLLISFIKKRK
jgi:hypothetical protein